jgi:flagellar motor switch protein FliM
MTDPVLSDEEKGALLDGMSNGEIEVHSTRGPGYATVTDFVVVPRSRIVTNSFPRMQSLNRQFATRMAKQAEQLLNAESTMSFVHVEKSTYSDFCESVDGLSLVVEFRAQPLDGSAFVHLSADMVETLVETFYGGIGNDSPRAEADFFTPGEVNVASLFCQAVLATTSEVWQPLQDLSMTVDATHLSSGIIDSIDAADDVIVAEFSIEIAAKKQTLHIVWPVRTVSALIPVFEGQKRERDAAQDAHWENSLRACVIESAISISSCVGRTSMTLRDVAALVPGDVINIGNPRRGTVYARNVAVLQGRFGVHDGRYAIETTHWIEPPSDTATP